MKLPVPFQASMAERVADLQQQGLIRRRIARIGDILPASFADPGFETDDIAPDLFDPDFVQPAWQALAACDLAAGLDTLGIRVFLLSRYEPFGAALPGATQRALKAAALELITLPDFGHNWHESPEAFLNADRSYLGQPVAADWHSARDVGVQRNPSASCLSPRGCLALAE